MLMAAFSSRSWCVPHPAHAHSVSSMVRAWLTAPHAMTDQRVGKIGIHDHPGAHGQSAALALRCTTHDLDPAVHAQREPEGRLRIEGTREGTARALWTNAAARGAPSVLATFDRRVLACGSHAQRTRDAANTPSSERNGKRTTT